VYQYGSADKQWFFAQTGLIFIAAEYKKIIKIPIDTIAYSVVMSIGPFAGGCSSMAELQLPKLIAWVRFPSPAP
jgi:hypothetical protein